MEAVGKRENKGAPTDIRFSSEQLSIDTRSIYFKLFCEEDDSKPENIESTILSLYKMTFEAEKENSQRIRMWVLRQSYTNMISLLIIAHEKWKTNVPDNKKILDSLSLFRGVLDSKGSQHNYKPEDDLYPHLIFHVAELYLESQETDRDNSKELALKYFAEIKLFTPYSKKRHELLRQCLSYGIDI